MKTQESGLQKETSTVIASSVASSAEPHRSITQRIASSAHETIDSAAVKADELELHLRAGAVKAGTKLESSQEAATAQVEKSLAKLESFVKARPIAAAGVLATALLRR
jgi:preprotein translocase subunit SecD